MSGTKKRIEELPDGAQSLHSGVGRDGWGWKAIVTRTNTLQSGGPCWVIEVEWDPETPEANGFRRPEGADPFRIRREFTQPHYVSDFIYHI